LGTDAHMGTAFARRAAAAWRWCRRLRWFDHLVRAAVRYDQADGGRLAAAITYYAFFATFALALLGFAVFSFALDSPAVARSVQHYLTQTLPRLDVQALRHTRGTVGVIAFVGLPVTGWFWVDALRSSMRKVWQLPEYPGALLVRVFVDLLVLVLLGLLLAATLAVAFLTTALASRVVNTVGADAGAARALLATLGLVVGIAVNTLLSLAVLTGLPRLRMPLRRVLGPALLVALGLELLKTLGRLYVEHTQANPTYQVVAGAVGLLVFLNVVNQLILFAAALTATSHTGQVSDLAERGTGRPPPLLLSSSSSGSQNGHSPVVSSVDATTPSGAAALRVDPAPDAAQGQPARLVAHDHGDRADDGG
jgi:membrane protein